VISKGHHRRGMWRPNVCMQVYNVARFVQIGDWREGAERERERERERYIKYIYGDIKYIYIYLYYIDR